VPAIKVQKSLENSSFQAFKSLPGIYIFSLVVPDIVEFSNAILALLPELMSLKIHKHNNINMLMPNPKIV
jgi:hypothetical protein